MMSQSFLNKIEKYLSVILVIGILFTPMGSISLVENQSDVINSPDGVSLKQNGSLDISGTLVEGGRVYFAINIKNFGSSSSPRIHPYVEGYTSKGALFRADGSNPANETIGPNSSKTFITQHDLWYGHAGTWRTYGIYIWNDDTNSYYGQLDPNGYSQTKSFNVLGISDIRQNGPISLEGSPFYEGGKIYLNIPVKNFGTAGSIALHPYAEGYTSQNKLWRADGSQPTAITLQPGQSTNFRIQHDLWYGHGGPWTTYGLYIWNDSNNSYFGPLNANGYNQQIAFNVTTSPIQSLDIEYENDANKAIKIGYQVVSQNSDGSLTVNLTIQNKRWIPFFWDVTNFGYVTDRDNSIQKLDSLDFMLIPPKTTTNWEEVRFPPNSQLTFLFPKAGYTAEQRNYITVVNLILILSSDISGEVPTGENYQSYDYIVSTISEGLWDLALNGIWVDLGNIATKFYLGDLIGVAEYIASESGKYVDPFANLSGYLLKSPLAREKVKSALSSIALILHFQSLIPYLSDLINAPTASVVKIIPSTRPSGYGSVSVVPTAINKYSEGQRANAKMNFLIGQLNSEIVASSSEHGPGWDPELILDGNLLTGWTSSLNSSDSHWITIRLLNQTPAILTSMELNPGPSFNDHIGSAIKNFHIDISLDSVNYTKLLSGSFANDELGSFKTFSFSPTLAEYVRLVVESNQSDTAVGYVDVGDILLFGTSLSSNDMYEPDSTSDLARLLFANSRFETHNFNYEQDTDWFYFECQTNQIYTLSISAISSDLSLNARIIRPNGSVFWEFQVYPGVYNQYRWQIDETGRFYISINLADAYGDPLNPPTTYSIALMNFTNQLFFPFITK